MHHYLPKISHKYYKQLLRVPLVLFRSTTASLNMAFNYSDYKLPRESAKIIAENSKDVKILQEGVQKTADLIFDGIKTGKSETDIARWATHELNPKTGDKSAVDWVFLSDVLNFSFWSEDESKKCTVNYKGKPWTGYWSLCAAINRALDEGHAFTDPQFYKDISLEKLQHLFRSDNDYEMPLIEERQKVLHEAGKVLCEKYQGSFVNVIKECDNSAQKLLQKVVTEFTSFRDVVHFQGQNLAVYKRAQIVIADIWACCKGEGHGKFHDIDTITMFADYRIPQALVWFNALEYSPDLMKILNDPNHRFNSGDRQEVEIRGCSIHAVDLIVQEINRKVKADQSVALKMPVNSVLVDHFLWDYRRVNAQKTEHIPIHRIRCIYY